MSWSCDKGSEDLGLEELGRWEEFVAHGGGLLALFFIAGSCKHSKQIMMT